MWRNREQREQRKERKKDYASQKHVPKEAWHSDSVFLRDGIDHEIWRITVCQRAHVNSAH